MPFKTTMQHCFPQYMYTLCSIHNIYIHMHPCFTTKHVPFYHSTILLFHQRYKGFEIQTLIQGLKCSVFRLFDNYVQVHRFQQGNSLHYHMNVQAERCSSFIKLSACNIYLDPTNLFTKRRILLPSDLSLKITCICMITNLWPSGSVLHARIIKPAISCDVP